MKVFAVFFLFIGLVYAVDVAANGLLDFSPELYKNIAKKIDGNVILSPLSVRLVLGLCALGARGKTADEMVTALYLPDSTNKIGDDLKGVISKLKGNQYYNLDIANKIYIKKGYVINPDFLQRAEESYDASLESIQFADNVKAADTINKWVESKTNNKIQKLVDSSTLDESTRMVLINTLYFQGNWTSPFIESETSKRPFHKSENVEVEVDTMRQTAIFQYAENKELDAKFIQLPYINGDITFTVVLPNKREGLAALEDNLKKVLLPQRYISKIVNLYLPKFEIKSSFKLNSVLKKMGIERAFNINEADFSGLFNDVEERLAISLVQQKAFIKVTESGTEATAATIVHTYGSPSIGNTDPIEIRVDHPFFFAIYKDTVPLFYGRMADPTA